MGWRGQAGVEAAGQAAGQDTRAAAERGRSSPSSGKTPRCPAGPQLVRRGPRRPPSAPATSPPADAAWLSGELNRGVGQPSQGDT